MPNVASSLLHTPCRSGSPQGVFGDTQFAGTGPPLYAVMTRSGAAAPLPWPDTGSEATVAITAAKPIDASTRLSMCLLLRVVRGLYGASAPVSRYRWGKILRAAGHWIAVFQQ